MYDVGVTMANAMPHKGVNIAFSTTMEMQQFGASSFWKVILFYYLSSLPSVNILIRKSPGPVAALIRLTPLAFLICLFRWDMAVLEGVGG